MPTITETEFCFYSPNAATVIDCVFECSDGVYRTLCYRHTLEETRTQYPDAVCVHWNEAWKARADSYKAPVSETTEEQFLEMLNILPPVGWAGCGSGAESFKMSEMLCDRITVIFVQYRGRYFTLCDDVRTTHGAIMEKVREFIGE